MRGKASSVSNERHILIALLSVFSNSAHCLTLFELFDALLPPVTYQQLTAQRPIQGTAKN